MEAGAVDPRQEREGLGVKIHPGSMAIIREKRSLSAKKPDL